MNGGVIDDAERPDYLPPTLPPVRGGARYRISATERRRRELEIQAAARTPGQQLGSFATYPEVR